MPRQKKQRLKQRADGRYKCTYRGHQFYGSTPDEALAARDAYKRQEAARAALRANPTVEQYTREFLKRQKAGASVQTQNEKESLSKKLIGSLGDLYIRDVRASDIKKLYTDQFSGLSESYIRSGAHLYRAIFDAAVDDGIIAQNPARQKSSAPHQGTRGGHRAITSQEREWIETLCTDHRAHAAIMAMLYAGLRPQEAKALNIDKSVDFGTDTIHLTDFAHLANYNDYEITSKGKTDNASRTIPLFPPLKKALSGQHGMLIKSADGGEITVQGWRSVWASYKHALETAINGCQERWYGKKHEHQGKKLQPFIKVTFTPYDLRHSFCTMCRDQGVELNTCIHWMGHADSKMILKIYDEFSQDRSKKEAEKLVKKLFSGSEEGSNEKTGAKTPETTE